jgi:hypothetical protein
VRSAVIVVLALAWPSLALADSRQVALPDPHVPLSVEPPLRGSTGQSRVPQTGRTREIVRVGVDAAGRPLRVAVVQHIELRGVGDYEFSVPAPVRDVYAPAGARAQPGLLDRAIVWQGFSPGRRDLLAVATLAPSAARALPLALTIGTHRDGRRFTIVLELRNRTGTRVPSFAGRGDAPGLARVLDGLRRTVARGGAVTSPLITADVRPAIVAVETPLSFRGAVTLGPSVRGAHVVGGRIHDGRIVFTGTLGGTEPSSQFVVVTGSGDPAPRVRLTAAPVRSVPAPPGGGSWRDAVAQGRVDGRDALSAAVAATLGLARANQYETFLATPGAPEQATAAYVYATARIAPAVAPPAPSGGDGIPGEVTVALALLALGAAAVAWAYL